MAKIKGRVDFSPIVEMDVNVEGMSVGDFFACESREKCTNGEDHDFSGDMVYFTPDGYETPEPNESSSRSVLCRRCGIDAMRYGP